VEGKSSERKKKNSRRVAIPGRGEERGSESPVAAVASLGEEVTREVKEGQKWRENKDLNKKKNNRERLNPADPEGEPPGTRRPPEKKKA